MEEPNRPPQSFYNWLNASYGFGDVNDWKVRHLWGTGWQQDPVYLYWNVWVNPDNPEQQKQQGQWELNRLVQEVFEASNMTEKEAESLFAKYNNADDPLMVQFDKLYVKYADEAGIKRISYLAYLGLTPEVQDYIKQWTTENDLVDRLKRITGLDDATKNRIYDQLLLEATAGEEAMRAGTVRAEEAARQAALEQTYLGLPDEVKNYLNEYTSKNDLADRLNQITGLDDETRANISEYLGLSELEVRGAKGREQVAQQGRATEVQEVLDYTRQNPLVTGANLGTAFGYPAIYDKETILNTDLFQRQVLEYIQGKPSDFVNVLLNVNQRAAQRGLGEEQANRALLASLDRAQEAKTPLQLPAMPSGGRVAGSFLEGTRLGEGTRLRSFIESEIPQIAEETRAKREEWWRRMNPEPEEIPTFEVMQANLREQANKWQAIAASAPTSEYTAQTVWGPGGLAGIAQRAYEGIQGRLGALNPADFPKRRAPAEVKPEEDPFQRALRETDWRAKYYRFPGTGLVSRLQPPIHFR